MTKEFLEWAEGERSRYDPPPGVWVPTGTLFIAGSYLPWERRTTRLERRRFLWLIGISSPSLIHKGKKRRRLDTESKMR